MGRKEKRDRSLTPLETLIMNALWDESPAAVGQVQDRLKNIKPMAYSTVLTMMRILRDKGYLKSERQGKADFYKPTVTRAAMGKRTVGEVIDSFFSGSAEALVSQMVNSKTLSDDELQSIRAELDKAIKDRRAEKE